MRTRDRVGLGTAQRAGAGSSAARERDSSTAREDRDDGEHMCAHGIMEDETMLLNAGLETPRRRFTKTKLSSSLSCLFHVKIPFLLMCHHIKCA